MTEKQPCPKCRNTYTIKKDGVMRAHTRGGWDTDGKYVEVPCEGPTMAQAPVEVPFRASSLGVGVVDWRVAQRKAYAKLGLKWPPKKVD